MQNRARQDSCPEDEDCKYNEQNQFGLCQQNLFSIGLLQEPCSRRIGGQTLNQVVNILHNKQQ